MRASTWPPRERTCVALAAVIILAIINLPYVVAYCVPASHVFGGILIQRADGFSYLAKMREGWRGELFTLPYTADPGPPVFLFSYYLALGRLAHWTGLDIEAVYQFARVVSSFLFLTVSYGFIARFVDGIRMRMLAWLTFVFASGLGWAAMVFGSISADLWVSEAFPFLSLTSNAHFPLTWASVLWLFGKTLPGLAPAPSPAGLALVALVVVLQAQVQPLALVTVGMLLGAMVVGRWVSTRCFRRDEWARVLVVGGAAAPWLLHAFLVTRNHPALAVWRAQSTESTPAWWSVLLAGGPLLMLAIPGLAQALRRRTAEDQVLAYWAILGALSLYAPGGFQRRLSLGLWMPVVLLAFAALRDTVWPRLSPRWRGPCVAVLAISATLTNVLLYVLTLAAVQNRDPSMFLNRDEAAALEWLASRPGRPLVIASPEIDVLVPARTDARVVFGHWAETVDTEDRLRAVEGFFRGELSIAAAFPDDSIDYVFYGPREKNLGHPDFSQWEPVFEQGDVRVFGRARSGDAGAGAS